VGDLVDPTQHASAADQATIAQGGGKADRGSGLGMYRAGGPTTIFGGTGWGPYSDGPLNAVRKSLLTRDGVNEENWMAVAAQRTADASAEWAAQRRARLRPAGGLLAVVEKREVEEGESQPLTKRGRTEDVVPGGMYEPHTHAVLYRADMQPTRARWEVLPDLEGKRQVLGGTKAGNGAWALAWVDTIMEVPPPNDEPNIIIKPPVRTPSLPAESPASS
jgi:chromatin structure-remodeling complex protein RSC7